MSDKNATAPRRNRLALAVDLARVSVDLLRVIHSRAAVLAWTLPLVVIALAVLPFMRAKWFGEVLDSLGVANAPSDIALPAYTLMGIWLGLNLLDSLKQHQVRLIDTHFHEFFASLFAKARTALGMRSFERGSEYFNLITHAEESEFNAKFFLPRQIDLIGAVLTAIVGGVVVSTYSAEIALVLVGAMLFNVYVQGTAAVRQAQLERAQRGQLAETTWIKNNYKDKHKLKGLLLFGIDQAFLTRLDVIAARIFGERRLFYWRFFGLRMFSGVALVAAYSWALWDLAGGVIAGAITVGQFSYLIVTLLQLGLTLTRVVDTIGNQLVTADQVVDLFAFLKSPLANPDRQYEGANAPLVKSPEVEARELCFGYVPERNVLSGVNLSFAPGELTFVVGANGAGKTTLFNLLSGLYPVPAGSLFVGNTDISELKPVSLREWVRHLCQERTSMRITIREALACVAPEEIENEELMWKVLAKAQLESTIRSWDQGLDEPQGLWNMTKVHLSGGQERKLNIAMLLMGVLTGKTGVVLLDEPFTGIDPESSAAILRTFREMDATVILTTHAIEMIGERDSVVFLAPGISAESKTVVHRGRHAEMLKRIPAYVTHCAADDEEQSAA